MMTSIMHRATGAALSFGTLLLVLWLAAVAGGATGYSELMEYFKHPVGQIVLIGMTFALMQHMASGIRHLFMDKGDLFDLKTNTNTAWMTYAFALVTTSAIWAYAYGMLGGVS